MALVYAGKEKEVNTPGTKENEAFKAMLKQATAYQKQTGKQFNETQANDSYTYHYNNPSTPSGGTTKGYGSGSTGYGGGVAPGGSQGVNTGLSGSSYGGISEAATMTPNYIFRPKVADYSKTGDGNYSNLSPEAQRIYNMAVAKYQQDLLNPNNLPAYKMNNGDIYYYMTPYDGVSNSTNNIVSAPTFSKDARGNIIRTDYLQGGTYTSLIKNLGGYTKSISSPEHSGDRLGDVAMYSINLNPSETLTRQVRGRDAGIVDPSYYDPNARTAWADEALARAGGYTQVLTPGMTASTGLTSTPTTPYGSVGASGAYVPATAGLTERQRAQEAIAYYQSRGMTEEAQRANAYLTQLDSMGMTGQSSPSGVNTNVSQSGYIDSSGAYQSNTPGLDDKARTLEAMQYYRAHGMTEREQSALAYAQQKGYVDASGNAIGDTGRGSQGMTPPMGGDYTVRMEEAAAQIDEVFNNINNLKREFAQYGEEGRAALAAGYNQMLANLAATEQQITAQIKTQMGGDDPQLLAAIGVVKEEAQRMQQEMLEEMNVRGIAQSGIYLKAMDNMNKGTLTEIQKLVSSRMGELQTQLTNALLTMAGYRINAAMSNQTNIASLQQAQMQGMNDLSIAGLEQQTHIINNANDYAIALMNNQTQRYGYDQSLAGTKYASDSDYRRTELMGQQAKEEISLKAQLDKEIAQMRAASGGVATGGIDPYEDARNQQHIEILEQFLDSVGTEYLTSNNPSVQNRGQLKSLVQAYGEKYMMAPEVINATLNFIDQRFPGTATNAKRKTDTEPRSWTPIFPGGSLIGGSLLGGR